MVRAHSSSRPANNSSRPNTNKPTTTVAKNPNAKPLSTTTMLTLKKPDEKGKLSPGAIAGIVIGSIAFVLIISFIIYKIKNR